MPCYNPVTAYWSRDLTENGKRKLVFNPKKALNTDIKVQVPCGQCIGCRLEYARVWALRCWHESLLYSNNCFITLTFDDDHLAKDGSLHKSDFVKFMKRLRMLKDDKGNLRFPNVRYFHCGEYGDQNNRPHHHAILFNCAFDDLRPIGISKHGDVYYRSDTLSNLWNNNGFCTIGDVTFQSCSYVARYVMKKLTGDAANVYSERGVIPPYLTMSRRPGIGRLWFEQNRKQVEDHLGVRTQSGVMSPVPRFYRNNFSEEGLKRMERVNFESILKKKNDINFDYFDMYQVLLNSDRANVLETVKKSQITSLKRSL